MNGKHALSKLLDDRTFSITALIFNVLHTLYNQLPFVLTHSINLNSHSVWKITNILVGSITNIRVSAHRSLVLYIDMEQ